MVGTMNPLEGNPRPSRAGRKSALVRLSTTLTSFSVTNEKYITPSLDKYVR
jgi:hypothetical protein